MSNLTWPLSGGTSQYVFIGVWASRPSASAYSLGTKIFVTDIGPAGSEWVSDGSNWLPHNGHVLLARSGAAASVTGTASETALATIAIPAGLMGTDGQLRVRALFTGTNSANAKTMRVRFGGISGTEYYGAAVTTTPQLQGTWFIANRGAANSQIGFVSTSTGFGNSSDANVTSSVDTSADTTLVISAQLANSGETYTLASYSVELLR